MDQKPRTPFIITLIVVLLAAAFFIGRRSSQPSSGIVVDLSRTSVIKQFESLNRLETASFTIEKVIEAGTTQGNQFQALLYGDSILLIADGKVVAGIDMSQVTAKDIIVKGSSISITVPAPTIFSTALDSSKTKVYDRKLGLLSKGNKDLESQARAGAETALTQAACSDGILDEAATNGRQHLTQLFTAMGYTSVSITMPAGTCASS